MMAMNMDKDKDMHIPSKVFMVNKNAVYAVPAAALIVVLFPCLVTNFFTISLYLFATIFFFFRSKKIIVTRDLFKTAIIMLLGVLIMAYSYDKKPVVDFPVQPRLESSLLTSMLLTSVICFVVFIQGYFYSFTVKNPLKFLRYALLYQWALVAIYFIVAHGFFIGNSLMLGNITIILLPYMYLVFDRKPKSRFIFSLIVLLYLMLTLCRTAFVGAVIFFLTYYFYPYLVANRVRYKLFFLLFFILIFVSIAIYLLSGFDFLNDYSKMLFGGKFLGRGRDIIWSELLRYIIDKPIFGYGINQNSGYFRSTAAILGFRGLDSHNIYLEMLVRGGILLLSFFTILFYRIWGSFYSHNNRLSRIAASGFLAFLFVGAGLPIGVMHNIVLNTLLWFFWGVAAGNTWIKNYQI